MSQSSTEEVLEIAKLRIDGGTQIRVKIDDVTVAEYAEAMSGGAVFPPIVTFFDGTSYWLADGFHRREAALRKKDATITARVIEGSQRDAVLFSVGTNTTHGLRRTNADKRAAVSRLLNDFEWSKLSANEIAAKCGVSQPFVSKMKNETINNGYKTSDTDTNPEGSEKQKLGRPRKNREPILVEGKPERVSEEIIPPEPSTSPIVPEAGQGQAKDDDAKSLSISEPTVSQGKRVRTEGQSLFNDEDYIASQIEAIYDTAIDTLNKIVSVEDRCKVVCGVIRMLDREFPEIDLEAS
jgi:hypothetical protein